jgi:hypothetical protein
VNGLEGNGQIVALLFGSLNANSRVAKTKIMMSLTDEKIKRSNVFVCEMERFELDSLRRECKKLEELLNPNELKNYDLYKHEHYMMGSLEGKTGIGLSLYVYGECLEYLKRYQEK